MQHLHHIWLHSERVSTPFTTFPWLISKLHFCYPLLGSLSSAKGPNMFRILRLMSMAFLITWIASAPFLEAATKEEEIKQQLALLKNSKDSKQRISAIHVLADLGQLKADFAKMMVPDFLKAIKDKDSKVRGAAATALGQIDPQEKQEIIDALTKMVKEEKDEGAKEGAARGLGAIGTDAKSAIPALKEAADKINNKKADKVYREAIGSIMGRKK
jgi:HEAT repeat protein